MIIVVREGHLLSLAELVPQSGVEDATCCPCGKAETPWTPRAGTLVSQVPHLS